MVTLTAPCAVTGFYGLTNRVLLSGRLVALRVGRTTWENRVNGRSDSGFTACISGSAFSPRPMLERYEECAQMLETLDKYLGFKYTKHLQLRIANRESPPSGRACRLRSHWLKV